MDGYTLQEDGSGIDGGGDVGSGSGSIGGVGGSSGGGGGGGGVSIGGGGGGDAINDAEATRGSRLVCGPHLID